MVKIIQPSADLMYWTPNLEKSIEYATRTCYKSHDFIKDGSSEKIFNQVVKQSHHDSVSEHGLLTFQLVTDRAVLAQLTRHRVGTSFSVESQRYCNYSKDKFGNEITVILPQDIEVDSDAYMAWYLGMIASEVNYFELLKYCKPETARSVLTNSTKVELTFSANVRALRHLFKLRMDRHAQVDIRHLCDLMYREIIEKGLPSFLFDDIVKEAVH